MTKVLMHHFRLSLLLVMVFSIQFSKRANSEAVNFDMATLLDEETLADRFNKVEKVEPYEKQKIFELASSAAVHNVETKILDSKTSLRRVPICDSKSPPIGWKYVFVDESYLDLKLVGGFQDNAQRFSWEGENWVNRINNDGVVQAQMLCSAESPGIYPAHKEIVFSFDRKSQIVASDTKERQSSALLLMSVEGKKRLWQAHAYVYFSPVELLPEGFLVLEIWSNKGEGWELAAENISTDYVNSAEIKRLKLSVPVKPFEKIKMVLRVNLESTIDNKASNRFFTLSVFDVGFIEQI